MSFPLFAIFVDFICSQARIRNDTSLNLSNQTDVHFKTDETSWKTSKQIEISVHKTGVSSEAQPDSEGHPKKMEDLKQQCPVHKKPHSYAKCRAFCEKSIKPRKAFLKENEICFRCCSSISHMATCKLKVTYSECQSENQVFALHPGTASWIKEKGPPSGHGGEEESIAPSEVSTWCTWVCGGDLSGKSCSKICLVKVHPIAIHIRH